MMKKDPFLLAAIEEARRSASLGGIPIGSVLVRGEQIVARGHNQRVQLANPILHAEIDCLQNGGRLGSYKDTVLYSTLMPCFMCSGAAVLFEIPRVVVGESTTFPGNGRAFMESHGIEVVCYEDPECIEMMRSFIADNPRLWAEDIGEL